MRTTSPGPCWALDRLGDAATETASASPTRLTDTPRAKGLVALMAVTLPTVGEFPTGSNKIDRRLSFSTRQDGGRHDTVAGAAAAGAGRAVERARGRLGRVRRRQDRRVPARSASAP